MLTTYCVILAGGSGTRFWPASRRLNPKQLLAIAPGSRHSLLDQAVRRIAPLCPPDHTIIATGEHLVEATRAALPDLPHESLLAEPVARNTAACIGWAASAVHRRDPDALMMVMPSDHHVSDERGFIEAVKLALASAAQGVITMIGIEPTRPDTGFGYIEMGDRAGDGTHGVVRFVEKPDLETAQGYVKSGRYVWNAGMFFFRASVMLEAIARYMPQLARGLERISEASLRGVEAEREEVRSVFEGLPSVSIDYGVMEREPNLRVVPGSFGWSDLGSWQSIWEMSEKDADNNVLDLSALVVEGQGNLVRDLRRGAGQGRVIALVGVDDMCVIETDDALLVMPCARAQDVRKVVDELARRGHLDKL